MSIKTYSVKTDGNKNLSKNFKVREFASKDGADTLYVDSRLVDLLQKIRGKFGAAVTITSGYRTASHNVKVGGAKNSYHTKGMAADIVVSGVSPLKVYLYADSINAGGAIYYPNSKFCHIDSRPTKYRAITLDGKSFMPEPKGILKKGSSGLSVRWMQIMLTYAGYRLTIDGIYGAKTKSIIMEFQRKAGLTTDGIFGPKSLAKLKEALAK